MEQDISDRLDEFCAEFDIPEKHHGSLRLLGGMVYVLGLDIEVRLLPRKEQSE
jgi:hypothetical protein